MSHKTFSLAAGLIFLLIAVVHVLRIAFGWHVTFSGWTLPMWVSWAAVLVAGYLTYEGFRLSMRP